MNKPSEYEIVKIKSIEIAHYKADNEEYINKKDFVKVLKEIDVNNKNQLIELDSYHKTIVFKEKREKDPDVYAGELAHFELEQKRIAINDGKNILFRLRKTLKNLTSLSEELEVAKLNLKKVVENEKIPSEKKKELLARWNAKVAVLELKNCSNEQNIVKLKEVNALIKHLEEQVELQQEVQNIHVPVPIPIETCVCPHCNYHYNEEEDKEECDDEDYEIG